MRPSTRGTIAGAIAGGLTGLALLALAGCGSSAPDPQQTVYALEGSYAAALAVEVAYHNLPKCITGGPKICSDQAVMDNINKADAVAWTAIKAAENTVRTPGVSSSAATAAVVAAQQASAAFTSITATLKVK